MDSILRTIETINEWTGRIFSWTIVILTLLVTLEVILRHVFNSPTIWNFEVTIQLYAFHALILGPYTLLHNKHVSIDVIYESFKPRTRKITDIISYLVFFFPFMGVLLYQGIKYAHHSWSVHERSWSVFAPPLYPIKTVIPVVIFLLLLQGAAFFTRQVRTLKNGGDNPDD